MGQPSICGIFLRVQGAGCLLGVAGLVSFQLATAHVYREAHSRKRPALVYTTLSQNPQAHPRYLCPQSPVCSFRLFWVQ